MFIANEQMEFIRYLGERAKKQLTLTLMYFEPCSESSIRKDTEIVPSDD